MTLVFGWDLRLDYHRRVFSGIRLRLPPEDLVGIVWVSSMWES